MKEINQNNSNNNELLLNLNLKEINEKTINILKFS